MNVTGPRAVDVVPARGGSKHLPKPPLMGPANKVWAVSMIVLARGLFVSPYAETYRYDIYQHIPAGYEQRTTFTDTCCMTEGA